MRGHECIVVNIVFDCANCPMIFQMFNLLLVFTLVQKATYGKPPKFSVS